MNTEVTAHDPFGTGGDHLLWFCHLQPCLLYTSLAPLIHVYFILEYGRTPIVIWPVVAEALVGALLGFCIPLAAAMATGGSGMGGAYRKSKPTKANGK